jgi:hypothetical protein
MKRILKPRHINNEGAEPLMSQQRPCPAPFRPFVVWEVVTTPIRLPVSGVWGSPHISLKGGWGNELALRAQDPGNQ